MGWTDSEPKPTEPLLYRNNSSLIISVDYDMPSSVFEAFCGYGSDVKVPCYGDKTVTFL